MASACCIATPAGSFRAGRARPALVQRAWYSVSHSGGDGIATGSLSRMQAATTAEPPAALAAPRALQSTPTASAKASPPSAGLLRRAAPNVAPHSERSIARARSLLPRRQEKRAARVTQVWRGPGEERVLEPKEAASPQARCAGGGFRPRPPAGLLILTRLHPCVGPPADLCHVTPPPTTTLLAQGCPAFAARGCRLAVLLAAGPCQPHAPCAAKARPR